jgi:hypothetical protein
VWDDAALRIEVLEQFCAPEWDQARKVDACIELSVVDNAEEFTVVARKHDGDLAAHITDVAARRVSWKLSELVRAVDRDDHEIARLCGQALRRVGSWKKTGAQGRVTWTDVPRVLAWLNGRTSVPADSAYRALGVAPQTLAVVLKRLGWTASGTKRAPVWTAPQ